MQEPNEQSDMTMMSGLCLLIKSKTHFLAFYDLRSSIFTSRTLENVEPFLEDRLRDDHHSIFMGKVFGMGSWFYMW